METREKQDFETDEEMISESEETDDYSEPNNENVNKNAKKLGSAMKIAAEDALWIGDSGASNT